MIQENIWIWGIFLAATFQKTPLLKNKKKHTHIWPIPKIQFMLINWKLKQQ